MADFDSPGWKRATQDDPVPFVPFKDHEGRYFETPDAAILCYGGTLTQKQRSEIVRSWHRARGIPFRPDLEV